MSQRISFNMPWSFKKGSKRHHLTQHTVDMVLAGHTDCGNQVRADRAVELTVVLDGRNYVIPMSLKQASELAYELSLARTKVMARVDEIRREDLAAQREAEALPYASVYGEALPA